MQVGKYRSHYQWLEEILPKFFKDVGVDFDNNAGIICAHGDKAYGYESQWKAGGLHFYHGVAIYLLTYCRPYSQVDPGKWVLPRDDEIFGINMFQVAKLLRGVNTMTISTPNSAFGYLLRNRLPAVFPQHRTNMFPLSRSIDVIKIQQYWVILTAVNTWMSKKIIYDFLFVENLIFLGTISRIFIISNSVFFYTSLYAQIFTYLTHPSSGYSTMREGAAMEFVILSKFTTCSTNFHGFNSLMRVKLILPKLQVHPALLVVKHAPMRTMIPAYPAVYVVVSGRPFVCPSRTARGTRTAWSRRKNDSTDR